MRNQLIGAEVVVEITGHGGVAVPTYKGEIVAVVPPMVKPYDAMLKAGFDFSSYICYFVAFSACDCESVIIKSSPKALHLAKDGEYRVIQKK